ncbi:PREDICTED: uncharacterized protein LOC109184342 [Ipomoea nil]|uniref:uncharacterized protein LOC109184342 n=1 Tax=Ipomoea nil TaxID=35883 RepID=UPI0009018BE8|nr:PREDICTED: uncharacterized protein LOC109184342 [Ipomoea nil]XP_019189884.1 PREDICTED: uncharacterized protein LOC109184342 [Ipomoea nil]XP_019189885.1 PREDICTED: uncharacterized protein LOC109184342 [Ipomoea nil]
MMLRKRSRSEQKAEHLMSDTNSHSDDFVLEHKNNSFCNIPGLFLGFNRKGSESGSLSSPTCTLDLRVFSSFANRFKFRRSSNEGSQKPWDCSKVGLSIIGSLDDELEQMGKTSPRSESKSIVFGPQMQSFQMHFGSFETVCAQTKPPGFEKSGSSDVLFVSGDSPLYQDSFGDIRSCSPDSGQSGSQLSCSNSNSELISSSLVFEKGMNPEVSSKPASSISAIEIQRSEYYTCVKTHSPYPKVTHIFGDCILEWPNHELTDSSKKGEKGIELPMAMGTSDGFKNRTAYPSSDFLSFCHHCKKELDGEDIYIYRGEKAFCSSSCRSEEILIDDDDEGSEKTNFGDEFPQNGLLFIAI